MVVPEAEITPQPITETIEKNYMPYVMSVIISRAIPDIDGFKPAHRKLLYTMYKMGLMTGHRTKSSNVVGQTMRLNPHGDASIYDALARLTRDNETLLHPFIDSKGSFGKQYSRDMACAAPRYTEVKLDPFCNELFRDIDRDAVDFVPNYDNTTTEPTLLPTTFPNILVSPNIGVAVGMATSICPFNLAEICDGTIAMLKNPNVSVEKMLDLVPGPDFPGGGDLLYDRDVMRGIYLTGSGSIKLRARYRYNEKSHTIEVYEIPYSSCIEPIMKKVAELVKGGKYKDIVDIRDAIDINGFMLEIEIRRNTDPDKIMEMLYRDTDLEDTFGCNFNVLIHSSPRVLGLMDILREWIDFRVGCVKRSLSFDLQKKSEKLHLLLGLGAILLDIDRAIRIIRTTEKEESVVPNLMQAFSLSQTQAEYIAEIKLRHLNREYITNRVSEIESLRGEIEDLQATIADDLKVKSLIARQLAEIKKKYGQPRRTRMVDISEVSFADTKPEIENYPVRLVTTRDGYFKKIAAQSLRGNDEQKLKEGDAVISEEDSDNLAELLILTNRAQVYKARLSDFETVKASALGVFLAAELNMDDGERPLLVRAMHEYPAADNIAIIFENGKGVRFPVTVYETKKTRRKLKSAYSEASPAVAAFYEAACMDILITTSQSKSVLIRSSDITQKSLKTSQGAKLVDLRGKNKVVSATADPKEIAASGVSRHKKIN